MKLYIGNLAEEVTSAELTEQLRPFGVIGECEVHYDKDCGRQTGFSLVEVVMADEAVESLNGTRLKGKVLRVSKAVKRLAGTPKGADN